MAQGARRGRSAWQAIKLPTLWTALMPKRIVEVEEVILYPYEFTP